MSEREAQRQQALVRALWRDDDAVLDRLRPLARADAGRGLATYRAHAGALAERALAAAFPTLAALIGAESFAALARHHWQAAPPRHGDVGAWGDALPDFVAASAQLADEPVLADSARLDWAVHRATRAADAPAHEPLPLQRLAGADPALVVLQLAPGAAVVASALPIVAVWRAHHGGATFDDVRAAFAARRAETAFVWRDADHHVRLETLSPDETLFTAAVVEGRSLAAALDAAGDGFAFDRWLARALRARWLVALRA